MAEGTWSDSQGNSGTWQDCYPNDPKTKPGRPRITGVSPLYEVNTGALFESAVNVFYSNGDSVQMVGAYSANNYYNRYKNRNR